MSSPMSDRFRLLAVRLGNGDFIDFVAAFERTTDDQAVAFLMGRPECRRRKREGG